MAEPEYTVTITIGTIDPQVADFVRNQGGTLVQTVEELASRSDARTLTHTSVETRTDLDPGKPGETYVGQLAAAVADELERRRRLPDPAALDALADIDRGVHLPFCTSNVPGIGCDCATRETTR